jgi:calpain-7
MPPEPSPLGKLEVRVYPRPVPLFLRTHSFLQAIYSKATKAELENDWDQACTLYVKSAASYLHLSRTTTDEKLRTRCKANASRALERAEKIKMKKRDLTPVAVDPFSIGMYVPPPPPSLSGKRKLMCFIYTRTPQEQQFYVLKKSSLINNLRFPLWDEPVQEFSTASTLEYVHQLSWGCLFG